MIKLSGMNRIKAWKGNGGLIMYEDLVKKLRETGKEYSAESSLLNQAADTIVQLEKENKFLKSMQKQMASVNNVDLQTLGSMVNRALKGQ